MEAQAQAGSGEDRGVVQGGERGSILFVCRNNVSLAKKAIRSAQRQDIPCDILVVDNASSDGTAQWLVTQNFSTISLRLQASLSACWNMGLATFFRAGRSGVLVLNADVEISPKTYRYLSSYSFHQKIPFVTCVSVEAPQQFHEPAFDWSYHVREHPDFSAFFITQEVIDRVGWFNEDYYPAYVEDCDYHVRMHRAGVKAICVDVPFLHHGATTIKNADKAERVIIARGAAANRERFKREYGCLPGTPEYQELFR